MNCGVARHKIHGFRKESRIHGIQVVVNPCNHCTRVSTVLEFTTLGHTCSAKGGCYGMYGSRFQISEPALLREPKMREGFRPG
jgi:hypothetical protein